MMGVFVVRLVGNSLTPLMAFLLASMPMLALAQPCNTGAGIFRLGNAGAGREIILSAPTGGGGLSVLQSGGIGGCTIGPQTSQGGSGLPIQVLLPGLTNLGAGRPSIEALFPSFGTNLGSGLKPPGGSAPTRSSNAVRPSTPLLPSNPSGQQRDGNATRGNDKPDGGDQGHHHGGGNSGQGIGNLGGNQGGNQGGGKPGGGDQGHHHGGGNSGQGGGNQGGGTPGGGTVKPPQPPTGIIPGRPGGVTPPIAVIPPDTLTPTRPTVPSVPGGVTPPIAVIPPDTLTPTRPTVPSLPGGVTPPIAVIPPDTLTPTDPTPPSLPGGVTPPTGTRPASPGTVVAPVGTVIQPDRAPSQEALRPGIDCRDPRSPATDPAVARLPECREVQLDCLPDRCQVPDVDEAQMEVPLTPGRDFGVSTEWNAWSEVRSLGSHDARYGLDLSNTARSAAFGLDRRFGSDLVAGLSFTLQNSTTGGYNGFLNATSSGVSIGPYVAYMLSPNWAIDASLSYSRLSNTLGIAMFSGSFISQSLAGSINLHGQYDLGFINVRPKVSGSYARSFSDGYQMSGFLLGQNLNVQLPSADYNVASFTAANEFNKVFTTAGGTQIMPYAEFGVQYDAIRINDGQILTGTLGYATPSAWTMTVRSGVRMLVSNAIQVDLAGGYLSLGQPGLDVIEAKLRVSLSF